MFKIVRLLPNPLSGALAGMTIRKRDSTPQCILMEIFAKRQGAAPWIHS